MTTPATTLTLACDANGDFDGANSLVCDPYACNVNNITNAVSNADYSDCDFKTTGQFCTPQCFPGYGISSTLGTASAQGIALGCWNLCMLRTSLVENMFRPSKYASHTNE